MEPCHPQFAVLRRTQSQGLPCPIQCFLRSYLVPRHCGGRRLNGTLSFSSSSSKGRPPEATPEPSKGTSYLPNYKGPPKTRKKTRQTIKENKTNKTNKTNNTNKTNKTENMMEGRPLTRYVGVSLTRFWGSSWWSPNPSSTAEGAESRAPAIQQYYKP